MSLATVARLSDLEATLAEYRSAISRNDATAARAALARLDAISNSAWYALLRAEEGAEQPQGQAA